MHFEARALLLVKREFSSDAAAVNAEFAVGRKRERDLGADL